MSTPFSMYQVGAEALLPPRDISVSQWADENVVLTGSGSAERGQWHTRPYQREPMDVLSPSHPCKQVVLMSATFGEIVAITRKVIVNDDLQALTRVPAGLGQAAANLESDTVWAVITGNPTMADTVALFHATHKNLNATNALALAALGIARAALRVQKAPKGTILNLQPRYLIVPAALEQAADQLIYPVNLAATAVTGVVPTWVQSLTKIVEGRLDAVATVGVTNWFMAVDPSQIDTIEYCYLEGQQGVYIETRQGFDVDGVEIKARLDFAAGPIDFRGLCKNTA